VLHVLPEAFESRAPIFTALFATLLGGLLVFWLLEKKAELYRHGHHHEGDGHEPRATTSTRNEAGPRRHADAGGRRHPQLLPTAIIIAAAFTRRCRAGLAHRAWPSSRTRCRRRSGDYIVLLNAGYSRGGRCCSTPLARPGRGGRRRGGLLRGERPGRRRSSRYLLMLAAASFIYIAAGRPAAATAAAAFVPGHGGPGGLARRPGPGALVVRRRRGCCTAP
jgi:zinc and cadmium transporter